MNQQVLFIGDKPGKKNIDPRTAFVGTKSYKTLLSWICKMNLSINNVYLENSSDIVGINDFYDGDYIEYHTFYNSGGVDKVVALGKKAEKFCIENNIQYFAMPHPSGLNRQLNDKEYVALKLKECEKYIKEEK